MSSTARNFRDIVLAGLSLLGTSGAGAFTESSLQPLGMNLGGVNYYTTPYFADAIAQGGGWLEYTTDFGTAVATFGSAQFDANGFPKYLNPGKKLRLLLYGLHANYSNRPAAWPVRDGLANGKIVVVWTGDADIRLNGGTFIMAESSGGSTGRLVNGRRVYRQTNPSGSAWLNVEDINAANPVTNLKAWLPDPADPQNVALEGRLFHPTFLARLAEGNWAFVRMMDWASTNADPEQDWSDRRLPTHVFQNGVLNPRIPATGFPGNRSTGAAFEHMVAACNAANRDLWINIPHLATDDFVTRMAQTICFGSDGVNPYSSVQAGPVYAPLNAGRRVFIEYSNEIWSSGNSFPQGNWAQDQATAAGISKAQFNARRFCQVWRLFQNVFGDNSRLVKVAAVWTGNQAYTTDFLNEIKNYGPTLVPAQEPDVIAPTTYFGNGIQDWTYSRAQAQAGTADPWFLTSSTFDAGGGIMRPVSIAPADPYWNGGTVPSHLDQTFREWTRLILSGSTQTGAGPDATGIGGGFDAWLRTLALTTFPARKPIVTYEGGPSIYTDSLDGGDTRDDGITTFMELLNRQPQMADIYRIHLNLSLAKGLRTHGAFVDGGGWGKFGEWGHLETIAQATAAAPKWQFLLGWETQLAGLRHIDDVLGTAPAFATAAKLPTAIWGHSYTTSITSSGGEGGRSMEAIGSVLSTNLSAALVPGLQDQMRISGTPSSTGDNFAFLRVKDADGDPAWRTFYFKTVGGPRVVVESSFEGTNPSSTRPWTPAYVKQTGLIYSGWDKGAGINIAAGNDALVYSQNMPATEAASTLAQAISSNEYWTASLQGGVGQPLNLRRAEVRFTIQRIDFHAPRQYAVMTSVGGLAAGNEVFTSARFVSTVDTEFVFTLPDTAAYDGLTGAVEFRLVGFSGQFAGHKVSIRGFKVTRVGTALDQWLESSFTPAQQVDSSIADMAEDPNHNGVPNLIEYALNGDPIGATTGTSILPQPSRSVAGNCLQVAFARSLDRNDIILTVQAADGLTGTWTDLAASVNGAAFTVVTNGASFTESGAGNTRNVTVCDLYQVNDPLHPRRFMRLQVTKP